VKSPEFNTSPENNVPTWEELLVGVLARKVTPPEDPNRPVAPAWTAFRRFRTARGDGLTISYAHHEGESGEWWLMISSLSEQANEGYGFEIVPHDGQLRIIPYESEIPLDPSAAEHLLQQVMMAVPTGDTVY
jgi:hypothetical protein